MASSRKLRLPLEFFFSYEPVRRALSGSQVLLLTLRSSRKLGNSTDEFLCVPLCFRT